MPRRARRPSWRGPERHCGVPPQIAARPGADLAASDLAADIVLRTIGMQRDFRPLQHQQQLRCPSAEPTEMFGRRRPRGGRLSTHRLVPEPIHRYPGRCWQSSAQQVAGLVEEAILASRSTLRSGRHRGLDDPILDDSTRPGLATTWRFNARPLHARPGRFGGFVQAVGCSDGPSIPSAARSPHPARHLSAPTRPSFPTGHQIYRLRR